MNSGLVMHEAEALASRLQKSRPGCGQDRHAYRLLFSRAPEPKEIELGPSSLKPEQGLLAAVRASAAELERVQFRELKERHDDTP